MTSILNNFVAFRKRRGDILDPTSFRTVVEMINGILKKYNFDGFNESYQQFIAHLLDYDDPHHFTDNDFLDEIIERTHGIYTKMLPSPLSLEDFKTTIVPTIAFLELIRRIVLNYYLYTQIKNIDGSVPSTVSVILTRDWNHTPSVQSPVTLSFGSVLADEDAFIRKGWNGNSSPVPAIFTALDLDTEVPLSVPMFHSSKASPHFLATGSDVNYPVSIFGSSNDLTISFQVKSAPTVKTSLLTLNNGTDVFTIAMNPDRSLELRLGTTIIVASLPCNEGSAVISLTRDGIVTARPRHNGVFGTNQYAVDFSTVAVFISATIGLGLENLFTQDFSFSNVSICKDVYTSVSSDTPIPMIFRTAPSGLTPVSGSSSGTGNSPALSTKADYNLYLTLSGTWSGTVTLMRSIDNGATWNPVTGHGSPSLGQFTQNCDEAITMVKTAGVRYRLQFNITSGTVVYRLAQ